MKTNTNLVTHSGNPLTLLGHTVEVGQKAPAFTVTNSMLQDVHLDDYRGKVVVLSVYPSIDTSVCATQMRQFNQRATALSGDVVILAISKDLPFALSRFCAAEGIDRVVALSDYKQGEFGLSYGFLIKENMLLARGVVVIDKKGEVSYVEYVHDITHEPDYDIALAKVASAI